MRRGNTDAFPLLLSRVRQRNRRKGVDEKDETVRFLEALFAGYRNLPEAEERRVEIRCLPGVGRGRSAQEEPPPRDWFPLTPPGLHDAARCAQQQAERWDVYYGVLPRAGEQGIAGAVTTTRTLWCDIDGAANMEDALQLARVAGLPWPSPADTGPISTGCSTRPARCPTATPDSPSATCCGGSAVR